MESRWKNIREFVSWDDDSQLFMESHKIHVPNHQSDLIQWLESRWIATGTSWKWHGSIWFHALDFPPFFLWHSSSLRGNFSFSLDPFKVDREKFNMRTTPLVFMGVVNRPRHTCSYGLPLPVEKTNIQIIPLWLYITDWISSCIIPLKYNHL